MATDLSPSPKATATELPLFSADSHVVEDPVLWEGMLPDGYFKTTADGSGGLRDARSHHARSGAIDPVGRIAAVASDGVEGEVLYPSLGLNLFGLEDPDVQRAAFERYNSWLIEFCQGNPRQLIGVALISAFDIASAVKELERCAAAGFRGCQIWQTPAPGLPFSGRHYEPFWDAAAGLGIPVSLHILTGFNYSRTSREGLPDDQIEREVVQVKNSVLAKSKVIGDTLAEILFSGVLDRHPDLKFVIVENEIGWLPFVLNQFDYFWENRNDRSNALSKLPSEYFGEQVFATFARDPVGTKMLGWWKEGGKGCMWSNDFPHPSSTWPHSQKIVAVDLGYLDSAIRTQVVRENAMRLYGLK